MSPILLRSACLALCLPCALPLAAADFTVNTLFDGALDHDTSPGDGVCASSRGGACGLRTAIEETNARSGGDRILFSVAGTIVPSTEGPLPAITGPLVLLGSSAPGYNAAASRIGQAPPMIYIDGFFLDGGADGITFTSGASSGSLNAIGIIGMPDDGVVITGSATQVVVDNNWIGVRADGSDGGNAGVGIHLNADGNFIGALAVVTEISGLGNLVSGNGSHGILIPINANGNRIRGNLIGLNRNGTGAFGNAGWGIFVSGSDNRIGELHNGNLKNGPTIAGNTSGGIYVFAGSGNRIEASVLGINVNGSTTISPGEGIRVVGTGNTVGGADPLQGNVIANHVHGIRVGEGVLNGQQTIVRNNRIGSQTFSQGTSSHGILVENGSGVEVHDNRVLNAGEDGIRVEADGTLVSGNLVGFQTTIFGVDNHGAGEMGIRVQADDVEVLGNVVGFSGRGPSGFDDGIIVRGLRNIVEGNHVGVTPEGHDIGNQTAGIRVGSTSETNAGNRVRFNVVRNNGRGIWVFGDAPSVGNAIELNQISGNGFGPPVDLVGTVGHTPNDVGDADEDVNRLLNAPELLSVSTNLEATPPYADVTYLVDTNTSAATYPLLVDITISNATGTDVLELLGTDVYTAENARLSRTYRVLLPDGTEGGWLVAQAHDAARNSSEVSTRHAYGLPDALFRDGFESP